MSRNLLGSVSLRRLLQHPAKPPSKAAVFRIDLQELIKEECGPHYNPRQFYPAHLGEILNDRNQIATKLRFGANSTIWLARDLFQSRWKKERFVAIKINDKGRRTARMSQHELEITKIITDGEPTHEGRKYVRTLLDSFTFRASAQDYLCLVFTPLREPLSIYKVRFEMDADIIPSWLLKSMVRYMLQALEYLHRKIYDDGRIIYRSTNNFGDPRAVQAATCLIDFGNAVTFDSKYDPRYGSIQTELYCAPEVILDAGWSYGVDIWSLGVMLWELLEGKPLFNDIDPQDGKYSKDKHLALVTALLGPPPEDLLVRGRKTSKSYHVEGTPIDGVKMPGGVRLEDSFDRIRGEDRRLFIAFVKRMLKWLPEERSTAEDLLDDPWLTARFDDDGNFRPS